MQFVLLVKSHANARYAQSMEKLAARECECMLVALNAKAAMRHETIAGNPFLVLDLEMPDEAVLLMLGRHSAIRLAAVRDGEWLRPIPLHPPLYLEPDLAHVLKYKGKTNVDFTVMMINCARCASAFARSTEPLTVLDPVCGRGTTLFCAVTGGDNAIGVDTDEKALHEADAYFARYLQYHRYKHQRKERSLTLRVGGAIRERSYTFANEPERYKQGDWRSLCLLSGDTAMADEAVGKEGCHLIVGDLPYGVQHAPRTQRSVSPFAELLRVALPAYRRALKPGGAIALSFNTNTLPKETLIEAMQNAGLHPLVTPPYHDFAHWVEQAVNRDMVVAIKEQPNPTLKP